MGRMQDTQRQAILAAVSRGRIEWRRHALERLAERSIPRKAVFSAIENGMVVESYPDARLFPSWLLSGRWEGAEVHVVAAFDAGSERVHVITAYRPDADPFRPNGTRRRT